MSLFDDLVDSTGDVANNVGDSARNMIESSINAENLLSTLRQNGDAAMSLLESFVNLGRQIDANKAVAIGLALAMKDTDDVILDMTQSLGQTRGVADGFQESIYDAVAATLDLGVEFEDVVELTKNYNEALGRTVLLTSDSSARMAILSEATGLAAAEVGVMISKFSDLGGSIEGAVADVEAMSVMAQTLGLNVGKFLETVADNLDLVNQYGFERGVEGLSKMVARAQALRFDIQNSVSIADSILSGGPEKAVELAAELSVLGGQMGDLTDPFALMFNSLNDVDAIQESLIDAAAASAQFNEETGKFEIAGQERLRLRAMAESLGLSITDVTNLAVNARKEMEAFEQLDFAFGMDISDDEKQVIANMAQMGEDGEMFVNLKTEDGEIEQVQLSDPRLLDNIDQLREQMEDANEDPEQALRDNTKALQGLADKLEVFGSKESLITLARPAAATDLTREASGELQRTLTESISILSETGLKLEEAAKSDGVDLTELENIARDTFEKSADNTQQFLEYMGISQESMDEFRDDIRDALDEFGVDLDDIIRNDNVDLTGEIEEVTPTTEVTGDIDFENPSLSLTGDIDMTANLINLTGNIDAVGTADDFIWRADEGIVNINEGDDVIGAKPDGPLDQVFNNTYNEENMVQNIDNSMSENNITEMFASYAETMMSPFMDFPTPTPNIEIETSPVVSNTDTEMVSNNFVTEQRIIEVLETVSDRTGTDSTISMSDLNINLKGDIKVNGENTNIDLNDPDIKNQITAFIKAKLSSDLEQFA